MSKNPFINALSALGYIVAVSALMNFLSQTQGNKPDTMLAPIVFLSVFTLSAAVMAYLFFYQPLLLMLAGKNKEGLELFAKTVGVFASFTVCVLGLLFWGVFG